MSYLEDLEDQRALRLTTSNGERLRILGDARRLAKTKACQGDTCSSVGAFDDNQSGSGDYRLMTPILLEDLTFQCRDCGENIDARYLLAMAEDGE